MGIAKRDGHCLKAIYLNLSELNIKFFIKHSSPGRGGGHSSISFTGMLVREQISTAQKNRMTLNLNPKKIECPKIQTQKNRMTQGPMFVKVRINMKSYYDFMFFSTVFFIQRIQVCDTKIRRPKK